MIGGAQYSVWMKGCSDLTNPETVSQFMQGNARNRNALRVFAVDNGQIAVSSRGIEELHSNERIRGLGERYGGATKEARESYEREHPPAAFIREAAESEVRAEPAPAAQPPVVRAPARAERVAAQTTTQGAPFTVYVFNTVIEPTQFRPGSYDMTHSHSETYHIDLNRLSAAERRTYEDLRGKYSNPRTAYDPNQMNTDLQAFIDRVSARNAWINPGAATQGTEFSFTQLAAGANVTSDVTESYTFRIDLNVLDDGQRRRLNALLGVFSNNPTEANNLERMQGFLNSLPSGAVIQRPTMA
ncbi:MAG: hypothetical protein PHY95_00305 [Candidatus ainarchaeum sp.]|nr:hypothetical protein [Candidatus ainarchaeum sp.]